LTTKASRSGSQHADEPDTLGKFMMTQRGLLEKGGDSLKWGDVFQMFKKKNFLVDVEDQDELKVFRNIKKSRIHRVVACVIVFSCADAISWILKHVDLENMYICNARGEPIASF
jgi:hypothetical protein